MNIGKVETNIKNIVDDLPEVTYKQIVYEAITNSIQANAKNIKINFISNSLDLEDTNKYIDNIIIKDNGDGFDKKNIKSFKEYKTDLKRDLGCKGIGRFLYLKVFKKIDIESLNKRIKLVIDKDILIEDIENNRSNTILKFNNPIKNITLNNIELEKDIKEHFIAYFKLLKDKKIKIEIEIFENSKKISLISSDDIPDFNEKILKINSHNFKLSYVLENNIKIYDGFYCAGSRIVVKNSELESIKKFKSLKGVDILYLLEGEYFDNNVNESRDNFSIYPKKRTQKNLLDNLSWIDIQNELKTQIKIIANEHGINIDEIANKNLKNAIELRPFLGHYLKDNKEMLDIDILIQNAKKALEKDKDFLRTNSNKMDSEYYQKLTIVTQSELAEYMFDRQKVIERLKQLTDENSLEKEIHNLFMKQKTTDGKENYRTNSLWLFDDRFMTYDKIFSDKQIKEIFPELSANLDRPDILSIVSNTYNREEITDIVIIELKKADKNITPEGAEGQLLKYSRYINQSNIKNSIRIWTYAFLKYSDDIDEILNGDKEYNKIPTHSKYPIYYKYHKNRNTIINFMDYRAIAFDAESRHQTFMKILNGKTI